MKDVKEYSVKWTHWDSNRECLKFVHCDPHHTFLCCVYFAWWGKI